MRNVARSSLDPFCCRMPFRPQAHRLNFGVEKMKLVARSVFAVLSLFVVLVSGPASLAQTANTGIVVGTVTDKASAVVPDAKVELVNAATNDTRSVMSNSSGQFAFPN